MNQRRVEIGGVKYTARWKEPPPSGRTATGYGPKLPTSWVVDLPDSRGRLREHRIYCAQWSNAGTAYVCRNGKGLVTENVVVD